MYLEHHILASEGAMVRMSKGTGYVLGLVILAVIVFSCTSRLPGQTPPHGEEESVVFMNQAGSRTRGVEPISYEHVTGYDNVFGLRYGVTTLSSSASLLFGRRFEGSHTRFVPHVGVSVGDMNGVSVGDEFGFQTDDYAFMSMTEFTKLLRSAPRTVSLSDAYASVEMYRMVKSFFGVGASGTARNDARGNMVFSYGPSAILDVHLGIPQYSDFSVWTKAAYSPFGTTKGNGYRTTFAFGITVTPE